MSKLSKNKRKDIFLKKFPTTSLENSSCDTVIRSKFNFSYLDFNQGKVKSIEDYGQKNIKDLFIKLSEFSKFPLAHWEKKPIGKGKGHIFEVYGNFPKKSKFHHPTYIPLDVSWARFRVGSSHRLAGFIVPDGLAETTHTNHKIRFDINTFYLVFFDIKHEFYAS